MYEITFSNGEIFTEKFRNKALERAKLYISGLPAELNEISNYTRELITSYYQNLEGGNFECEPFVKVEKID